MQTHKAESEGYRVCICMGPQAAVKGRLTREKGERSGLRPVPMVASDQTTMKETPATTSEHSFSTQGCTTHL